MRDQLKWQSAFNAFMDAQVDFDQRVEEFKARSDAADAAALARAQACQLMTQQLAEVDRLAAVLAEFCPQAPDIIANDDMARAIRKGREIGELHAIIEAHAPKPPSI